MADQRAILGSAVVSDTTDFGALPVNIPRATRLYCGSAGTVKVLTTGGDTITLTVIAGADLSLNYKRLFATGTTVTLTNIVVLWEA